MSDVKFPKVKVKLSGEDGNAYFILGKVNKALRKAGASDENLDQFMKEAKSGDYDHLLQTCMRWVDIN